LGLVASLTAWFVHGLFDYFYEFTPTYVAFWFIAALAVTRRSPTAGQRPGIEDPRPETKDRGPVNRD